MIWPAVVDDNCMANIIISYSVIETINNKFYGQEIIIIQILIVAIKCLYLFE